MGKGFLESQSTIGVEFGEIEVRNIEENVDISIQVWDTCKKTYTFYTTIYLSGSGKIQSINNKSYKKCRWDIISI